MAAEPEAPVAPLPHQVVDRCDLLAAHDGTDRPCDGSSCVYWRVLGHVGVEKPEDSGCAVRHLDLLGGENAQIATWLVSVKSRLEAAGVVDGSFPRGVAPFEDPDAETGARA
jgi:hypothetical protein